MRKIISIFLSVFMVCLILNGCSKTEKKEDTTKEIKVTDLKGREVTLSKPAEKIFLGFYLENYIAVSEDSKLDNVVSMAKGEVRDYWNALWRSYLKVIPKLDTMIDTGSFTSNDFSVEKLLESKPDLVILAPYQFDQIGDNIAKIEEVGIKVVVLDYNSVTLDKHYESTIILGKILGKEDRAKELADAYKAKFDDIAKRVEKSTAKSKRVYIELASQGADTYGNSYGKTLWGGLLEIVKADNIATGKIEKHGPLSPEYVISSDPEVVFFTGRPASANDDKAFVMGFGVTKDQALKSMIPYTERAGWSDISAVKNKEVYGVDHSGLRTLYDYVYIEYIAKQLHPEAFKDVDPLKNLEDFYAKYLPVKPEGTFMISLEESNGDD